MLGLLLAGGISSGCLAETVSSGEGTRPLLNSERIREKFGSYGIEVLRSDGRVRVSDLFSVHNEIQVCRTFAVTVYPEKVDARFAEEHELIVGGQSIGEVFKSHGWTIEKRHRYFGEIEADTKYSGVYQLMGEVAPTKLAVHVYAFVIQKDDAEFAYALITEVHHPDYLTLDDLSGIYSDRVVSKDSDRDRVGDVLDLVLREMETGDS